VGGSSPGATAGFSGGAVRANLGPLGLLCDVADNTNPTRQRERVDAAPPLPDEHKARDPNTSNRNEIDFAAWTQIASLDATWTQTVLICVKT